MNPTARHCIGSLILLLVASVVPVAAVPGVPDQVGGASLVVPYFEVGRDVGANSHDTLMTVHNVASFPLIIHWTVWTPRGLEATSMSGNVTIPGAGVWSRSTRDMIRQTGSQADKAALVRGDFWRGFITIDVVTENTSLNPFAAVYPFSPLAALEGYTYYTRTGEGSANGLRMIPLEPIAGGEDPLLKGFYAASETVDARERIDARARLCAAALATSSELSECDDTFDGTVFRIRGRAFLLPALNGETRMVIFAWNTFRPFSGGPSAVCDDNPPLDCASEYTLRRYVEDGTLEEQRTIRLDDVVTVIKFSGPTIGGILSIRDVPDPDKALQLFTFAFNSAKPPGASQNWDAIFEGVIVP